MSVRHRWQAAADLVAANRDVLQERSEAAGAAPALVGRGWSSFLLSLTDNQLEALESDGLDAAWPEQTPSSLTALIAQARATCALPSLVHAADGRAADASTTAAAKEQRERRHERPRKQAQVDAFAQLILPLATRATRVLDVGSGHGHLTREIAERVAVPVIGLERNEAVVLRARALANEGNARGAAALFAITDVLRDGLPFAAGDCVIGLHACGELGDAVVASVCASRAPSSVALVACCLQKQRAPWRRPLCGPLCAPEPVTAALGDALVMPKSLLGLSNLTMRDDGVEATRSENLRARERRLALHHLLSKVALGSEQVRFGTELEGLNRRAAHLDLPTLVARAFAHRALSAPSTSAIDDAAAWAHEHHARKRRLQLPRTMLGRVLEMFVLFDRTRFLEDHGFSVEVGVVFPLAVSPRNLALVATRS